MKDLQSHPHEFCEQGLPRAQMPPQRIIEAARALEVWAAQQGAKRWELLGVCSRNYAIEAERLLAVGKEALKFLNMCGYNSSGNTPEANLRMEISRCEAARKS